MAYICSLDIMHQKKNMKSWSENSTQVMCRVAEWIGRLIKTMRWQLGFLEWYHGQDVIYNSVKLRKNAPAEKVWKSWWIFCLIDVTVGLHYLGVHIHCSIEINGEGRGLCSVQVVINCNLCKTVMTYDYWSTCSNCSNDQVIQF